MYDKKELNKLLEMAEINNDSPLVHYFKRQFKKGYRKYKTNDLSYLTRKQNTLHLLEEIIDAIVYTTYLLDQKEDLFIRSKLEQLKKFAEYLEKENKKNEKVN